MYLIHKKYLLSWSYLYLFFLSCHLSLLYFTLCCSPLNKLQQNNQQPCFIGACWHYKLCDLFGSLSFISYFFRLFVCLLGLFVCSKKLYLFSFYLTLFSFNSLYTQYYIIPILFFYLCCRNNKLKSAQDKQTNEKTSSTATSE